MARRDPNLTPAGDPERALYEAVTARYDPITDFVRAVSANGGKTFGTEKKALYRYINGGSIPDWRLQIYAQQLGVDVSTITRSSQGGGAGVSLATISVRLRAIEAKVDTQGQAMTTALQALAEEVRKLVPQQEPANRRARTKKAS